MVLNHNIKLLLLSLFISLSVSTLGQKSLFSSKPTKQLLKVTKSEKENVFLARKLIHSGADINRHDVVSGVTWYNSLQYAAENEQWKTMDVLIRAGAHVNPKRPKTAFHYFSPLMHATNSSLKLVKLLVSRGAKINDNNSFHNTTPLMFAAHMGKIEIVSYLLKHGANATQKDLHRQTAIDYALSMHHNNVAQVIKSYLRKQGEH